MSKQNDGASNGRQEPEKDQGMEELLEQERRRYDELMTRMKYLQADFENYRKRVEKEMREVEELSARGLVARLLSVLDELELAAANAEKQPRAEGVSDGIKMVGRNLGSVMKTAGLKRIEAVGMPFDPALHEAVEKAEGSRDFDVVVEEIRPGYTFRGQVLRPSLVKVELAAKAGGQEEKSVE